MVQHQMYSILPRQSVTAHRNVRSAEETEHLSHARLRRSTTLSSESIGLSIHQPCGCWLGIYTTLVLNSFVGLARPGRT